MSVREAQKRIDAYEFAEWMALYRIEHDERQPSLQPKYQIGR